MSKFHEKATVPNIRAKRLNIHLIWYQTLQQCFKWGQTHPKPHQYPNYLNYCLEQNRWKAHSHVLGYSPNIPHFIGSAAAVPYSYKPATLSQTNPIHTLPFHFFSIHFDVNRTYAYTFQEAALLQDFHEKKKLFMWTGIAQSARIALRYGMDRPWIEFRLERDFPHPGPVWTGNRSLSPSRR
jgi:hypothetical protein